MPFRAQYTKDQARLREDLIIKYVVSLIKDAQQMSDIIPHFLDYGIIDWSWPLRFVRGNQPYKGYKFYSHDAYAAILKGEKKFTRDHIIPKKMLKGMLLNMANPEEAGVRELMEKYGEVCVITRQEDARLRNAGLGNKMPDGWRIGDDIFARYQGVGIGVKINNRQWE